MLIRHRQFHVMVRDLRHARSFLRKNLAESRSIISVEPIIDPSIGIPGFVSPAHARRLNEAYVDFCAAESVLKESYSPNFFERVRLFESFLTTEATIDPTRVVLPHLWERVKEVAALDEEDEAEGKPEKKGFFARAKDAAKGAVSAVGGAVGKGLKKVSKAVAGKRRLEKGGSLLGIGKKSKTQQAEYSKMLKDEGPAGETLRAIKNVVGKDYPNNDDPDEFKKETMAAIKVVEDMTQSDKENAATIVRTYNKWISYLLDQEMGDHYLHFMESRGYINTGILLEAEGKKDEPDEEGGLSTKSGGAESYKSLKSEILPNFLKFLGGVGLGVCVSMLKLHPEIISMNFLKAIVREDVEEVTVQIQKYIPPVVLESRFVKDAIAELAEKSSEGGIQLKTAEEYKKFIENYPGGPKTLFTKLGVDAADGNSAYIMKRLAKGMPPDKAFQIGDVKNVGQMVPGMERLPGKMKNPVDMAEDMAVSFVSKQVKKQVITMVGAGVAGSVGTVATTAAAAVVGASGYLSGFAIQALRKKSQDPKYSRAAFLNDLYKKFEEVEEKFPDVSEEQCKHCGAEVKKGTKVGTKCKYCGVPFGRTECEECGAPVQPGKKCKSCGTVAPTATAGGTSSGASSKKGAESEEIDVDLSDLEGKPSAGAGGGGAGVGAAGGVAASAAAAAGDEEETPKKSTAPDEAYKTLGLQPGASKKEVKDKYKKLVAALSSKKNKRNKKAKQMLKDVRAAFETINKSVEESYFLHQGTLLSERTGVVCDRETYYVLERWQRMAGLIRG